MKSPTKIDPHNIAIAMVNGAIHAPPGVLAAALRFLQGLADASEFMRAPVPFGVLTMPVVAQTAPKTALSILRTLCDGATFERAVDAGKRNSAPLWDRANPQPLEGRGLYEALANPIARMFLAPELAAHHAGHPMTVAQGVQALGQSRRFLSRVDHEPAEHIPALRTAFGGAVSALQRALARNDAARVAALAYPGDDQARRAYEAGRRGDHKFGRKLSQTHRRGEILFFGLGVCDGPSRRQDQCDALEKCAAQVLRIKDNDEATARNPGRSNAGRKTAPA